MARLNFLWAPQLRQTRYACPCCENGRLISRCQQPKKRAIQLLTLSGTDDGLLCRKSNCATANCIDCMTSTFQSAPIGLHYITRKKKAKRATPKEQAGGSSRRQESLVGNIGLRLCTKTIECEPVGTGSRSDPLIWCHSCEFVYCF